MGLIDRCGADLLDKVFLWQADFNFSHPGDVWFIGKVTGYRQYSTCLDEQTKVFYKTLLTSHVVYHNNQLGMFMLNDTVDENSILIGNSPAWEKYLGLFNGIN